MDNSSLVNALEHCDEKGFFDLLSFLFGICFSGRSSPLPLYLKYKNKKWYLYNKPKVSSIQQYLLKNQINTGFSR